MDAFAGQPVEIGRLEEFGRFLHEAEKVVPVVIAQDQHHVTRLGACGNGGKRQQTKKSKGRGHGFHMGLCSNVLFAMAIRFHVDVA